MKRVALWIVAALAVLVLALLIDGWEAFGRIASGERLERMERLAH